MQLPLVLGLVGAWALAAPQDGALSTAQLRFPAAPEHLKHFGFALVDCGFDDPTDAAPKTSYLDEVAAFSNSAHLCPLTVDEDLLPSVTAMAAQGVRALLSVDAILFQVEANATSPSGLHTSLHPDYLSRWATFVGNNANALDPSLLTAISIVDEPTWNGLEAAELAQAAALIEATLPDVPTVVIEAAPSVPDLVVPPSVDWLAFDRYGTWFPHQDATYLDVLAQLEAKLTRPEQRLLLIAESQWLPLYGGVGVPPWLMGDVFLSYYLVGLTHPRVIGIVGYLWPSGFDDPGQLGARHLPPSAQIKMRAVGSAIVDGP